MGDETYCRIDRIRTAKSEVDVTQRCGRELHQFGGKADRRFRAKMEITGRIRKFRHLLSSGTHDAVMAVADIYAPEAGKRIEKFVALGIAQVRALA